MIEIEKAPAFATVQARSRVGWRAHGLPGGGALDTWSFHLANALVGNRPDDAAIEWMLGVGRVRFLRPAPFALTGADVSARLSERAVLSRRLYFAAEGEVLQIDALRDGRALYLAFGGGLQVPSVLGSRATYVPARLGGLDGRPLRSGDQLTIGKRSWPPPRFEERWLNECPWLGNRDPIRVIPGPQWCDLAEDFRTAFFGMTWTVGAEADRAGLRLESRLKASGLSFTAPSEPVAPGTIQLTPDGRPLVLLADGPTVGGYPKLGVVASVDLGRLAQTTPGALVQFQATTVADAQQAYRSTVTWLAGLRSQVRNEPAMAEALA